MQTLNAARSTLEAHGGPANAAHAGYLEARRLLLIGQLDAAERTLDGLDTDALPPASRAGRELFASGAVIVDACRHVVHAGEAIVPLATRPVLFALARALAQAWPEHLSREALLARVFRARHIDESHRVRLRVEIGRLRKALEPLARVKATKRGFALALHETDTVVVSLPLVEDKHANVLALLADGEAWPSSALAVALDVSPRTVQRALEALAASGQAESTGRGRNCRWIASNVPGFPTSLLLPAPLPSG